MHTLCQRIVNASNENTMKMTLELLSENEINMLRDVFLTYVIYDRNFETKKMHKEKLLHDVLNSLINMKKGPSEWDGEINNPTREKDFYSRVYSVLYYLKTLRELSIEKMNLNNIQSLHEITMEEETMSHIGRGNVWDIVYMTEMLKYDHNYVIFKNNQVIGYIGLHPYENDSLQLRIFIGKKYINRGYAKRTIRLFVDYIDFDFYAVVREDNIASNKLIKSSSFTFIETRHIYGSRHNVYKFFKDRFEPVFYIPQSEKNGLQFNELEHVLAQRGLMYADRAVDYGFIWQGRDRTKYSTMTLLKSNIDDHMCITQKLNLYANMLRYDNYIAEKYMAYTCELIELGGKVSPVGILSGRRINLDDGQYYIVKPVNGYSGDGITVIDNLNDLSIAYREAKKILDTRVTISQYIQDILLFQNKKFHMRVYLLVLVKGDKFSTFLWDKGKIMTSKSHYDPHNTDKNIFDTHLKSTDGDLFLDDLRDEIGEERFADIMKHTTEIMVAVSKMIRCVVTTFSESKYGFEIYAADLIVRDNDIPVLLEINDRVGYDMNDPGLLKSFSQDYFEWIDNTAFSSVFDGSSNLKPLFESSRLGLDTIEYRKFYGAYGNNYNLAKRELPLLIEYPYLRYYKSSENVYKDFEKLRKCVYTINSEPFTLHNIKLNVEKLKFNGKFHRIISTEKELQTINSITDYFSEDVRVHCKFLSNTSIYEYYNRNISLIIDNLRRDKKEVTMEELRESLWRSKIRQCTTFKPKIIKYIIELFGAKKVLDISSGWGDRLIGTMASDVDVYHGFDPNVKLQPKYTEIMNFFGKVNPHIQCRVDPIPFEEANLSPDFYDLVMSSPPYFTMETYSKEVGQSIYDNPDEREWFDNYLVKWVENARFGLRNDGILALNINQERDKHYVNWLIDYMDGENSGFKYIGMIGYSNEDGKNPQPIFIWKKAKNIYYNKVQGSGMYTKKMRAFHNEIKQLLIKGVGTRGGTLVDLAVGKGGDIRKWAGLGFVLGIDVMQDNIDNPSDGANFRYNKLRSEIRSIPECVFFHGDSSKNIKSGDAFYNDMDKLVFNNIMDRYILRKGFDVCSIQFAIHYMFKSEDTLRNFLTNVRDLTKVGGYFIGTSYDGKRVFDLLKGRDTVELDVANTKIWEITKRYNSNRFLDNESSLGYAIDVYQDSINNTFTEYLVNYDYLNKIIKSFGFKLLEEEEWRKLGLPSSSGFFDEFDNKLSGHEKKISYLNRFFVYKRFN